MKPKPALRSFLALAGSSILVISSAQAATYYWDTNETTSGFGTATGASLGTWAEPTVSRWTTATNTTTATDASRTIGIGDSVNFGDGVNGLGAGTITVSGTVDATNITFGAASGEIILSGGSINLNGTATVTVMNASDTINSQISGAGTSLTKRGMGTLKLTGANNYTGATIVSAGTLDLGGSGTTGSLASTVLTLGGGALHYTRTDSAIQTFTTTNFNSVESSIFVTDADAKLNLGTVARATGVTFDFATAGSGTVAALAASNTGGIMAGFTVGNSWAVANGVDTAITGLASYTTTTGLAANAYADNIDVDSINATPDAGITVNSLRFSESAANILTLSGSNTITTGGILVSSDVGNNLSTITGGTLVGAASKDLSVIQKNTLNNLTISSIIADSGGATTLAKSGAGTLILSGANSYTGTTAINHGTLQVNSGGTLGAITAPLTMGTGVEGALGTVGNLTLNTSATVGAFTVKSNTSDTTTPSNINQLSIASGSTLTASSFTAGIAVANYTPTNTALSTGSTPGAGGTLTVTGATTIGLTGPADYSQSTTVVDLRGLHTFNSGALDVGKGSNSKAALYLANNTNTINGAISVGDSVVNYTYAGVSHLYLGAGTNALQAATITLGLTKGAGQILFAGPSGSVTITGANGSGTSAITIGKHSQSSYHGTAANSLLLAGHTATVSASTVIIGTVTNATLGNTMDNLLTFDTGTFNATSIEMGVITDGSFDHATNGIFTVGGNTENSAATGIVNVEGNVLLGKHTSTAVGAVTGILTINGGTVNVNTTTPTTNEGIFDASTAANATKYSTLTLAGGTLNLNGGRIGGTLGTTAGKRNIDELNFRSGTLMNVASINDTAGLTKTTNGTLTIAGTNTYSGATIVSAGTLYVTGALSNSAVTVQADGTVGSNGGVGSRSLGNGLTIDAGGNLDLAGASLGLNSTEILSLNGGSLTLGNLTFQDIVGWDWANAAAGNYELIDGSFTINWGSTAYLSEGTAYSFGNGKSGYFASGSLTAVIVAIPEPNAAALLGGLGMLMLLRRRRN